MTFRVRLTPFRHTGVFPEQGVHWRWLQQQCARRTAPAVLVLFGYTGLATLVAAQAGAQVCHVDASRPAMRWARDNQVCSGIATSPVRWITDDVLKFVRRDVRRGSRYDIIMMDPPVFGRGPKGEIWRIHESLPVLVDECRRLLSAEPLGMVITAYATTLSAVSLANVLADAIPRASRDTGTLEAGELALLDGGTRPLSTALYARWTRSE